MKKILLLIIGFLFFLPINTTLADGKKFARSYTAETLPASEFEFELSLDNSFGKMNGTFQNYKPRFEIEYGVLDNLTASFYFNFNGTSSENNSFSPEPFKLESNSLELRYRFTDAGVSIIDPAVYCEFEFGKNVTSYEPKILLSKNYKNFTGVLNIGSEFERETDTNERSTNFEITGGAVYRFTPLLASGFEFRHSRIYENTFGVDLGQATFLGPTINLTTEDFNLTLNVMKQLAGSPATSGNLELLHHEKYEFSALLELEF